MDLAPHGVDLVGVLLGEDLVELTVRTQRRVHSYRVDDGALLAGVTGGGCWCRHTCRSTPPTRSLGAGSKWSAPTRSSSPSTLSARAPAARCPAWTPRPEQPPRCRSTAARPRSPVRHGRSPPPYATGLALAVGAGSAPARVAAHRRGKELTVPLRRTPARTAATGSAGSRPAVLPGLQRRAQRATEDGWRFDSADDVAIGRRARWAEVTRGDRLLVRAAARARQYRLGDRDRRRSGRLGGSRLVPDGSPRRPALPGGLVALGASHVHGYGALWQLQDELAPPVLAIGVDDLVWTKAFQVTWPTDDRHPLAPGLVTYRSGGHFPGHNVLHDERRGILFVGDLIKVELAGETPIGLSCHKAFHAQIPLSHAEVAQARDLVETLDFDAVATPFEYAAPVSAGRCSPCSTGSCGAADGRAHTDRGVDVTRAVEPRTPTVSALSVADRLADALPPGEVGDFDVSGLDRLGLPVISADHLGDGWPGRRRELRRDRRAGAHRRLR
ncbi:hypothetical protein NKG94_15755 [Micromonospora sp. M12]